MSKDMFFACILMFLFSCVFTQSFPGYYDGPVFTYINASLDARVPFKIYGKNKEYNIMGSERDEKIRKALDNPKTSISSYPSRNPPINKTGQLHYVEFQKGIISRMEVLDNFDFDGEGTVPILICTSWYESTVNGHSPGKLTDAIKNNNILNATMFTPWQRFTSEDTKTKNVGREWVIDEYLCYYESGAARFNILGECVIPYTDIINHYKSLWPTDGVPSALNGRRIHVTNLLNMRDLLCPNDDEDDEDDEEGKGGCSVFPCPDEVEKTIFCSNQTVLNVTEKIKFVDPLQKILENGKVWFELDTQPVGIGWIVNATYGYNRDKNVYELNFTILFSNWTFDLPHGLLDNYRDESFHYSDFKLQMHYWVEDPPKKPERHVPNSFWVMSFIMIGPLCVIILAVLLLMCGQGSHHVFNLKVWKYASSKGDIHSNMANFKDQLKRKREIDSQLTRDIKIREELEDSGLSLDTI